MVSSVSGLALESALLPANAQWRTSLEGCLLRHPKYLATLLPHNENRVDSYCGPLRFLAKCRTNFTHQEGFACSQTMASTGKKTAG